MAMPLRRSSMTLDEYLALPEDDSARFELQEGVLVMAPHPRPRHQNALFRLGMQIHRQLPPGLLVLLEVDVIVRTEDPAIVRSPDLVVTRAASDEDRLVAADVLLAVEIISPGSRNVDLHLKPFEYAEAVSRTTGSSTSTRRRRRSPCSAPAPPVRATSNASRCPVSCARPRRSSCGSTSPTWWPKARPRLRARRTSR
ncbi:hypothetical protein PA7_35560 [Pseudonocardia asaccharolytica DSM 44247 = NBRC 16224]|uniref:Putative restriction endonuclease domain-containing protein n=1 Tax=Pseudonocardia asaccharolytica DSM 44247 = NBRC 16224 TaxID=1123024 RepID=A0A511D4J9_9PSEU|nr:hypothetical protein PA7_35560 [Pseudonocardia asaccharolytica DSM 44247 = NBRC 16224]